MEVRGRDGERRRASGGVCMRMYRDAWVRVLSRVDVSVRGGAFNVMQLQNIRVGAAERTDGPAGARDLWR